MKLSIVIPVMGNWNFTKTALKDLSKLPSDQVEVIVIDNGSSDETEKWSSGAISLEDAPKSLKIIVNKKNEGFAKASNQGFAQASGDCVLFLNNDIKVKGNYEDWVFELIDWAEKGYVVGPTVGILDKNFNFIKEDSKVNINPDNFYYMSGWNVMAKKSTWEKYIEPGDVGPFSTSFFSYFEDTDLSFRMCKAGQKFKLLSVPVFHFGRTTSRKLNLSEMYFGSKNTFVNKWTKNTDGLKFRID